jgi:hypothetical protein
MTTFADPLAGRILTNRGRRGVLDADLARLYGVPTKRFNEAVRRNAARFPTDFAFQLSGPEFTAMRSQFATTSAQAVAGEGGTNVDEPLEAGPRWTRRRLDNAPWAFTEHGAVMAANILRSPKAVAMSVLVVRAFVRMREVLVGNQAVLRRLAEIDRTLLEHDAALRTVWERLRPLLTPPPERPAKEMGFHTRLPRK